MRTTAEDSFAAADAELARLTGRARRDRLAELLDGELKACLDALPEADEITRERIVERAGAFAEPLGDKVFDPLPALTRLKWHLARRRLVGELVKVIRYERGKSNPAIIRDPVQRYVVHPYWKDDKLQVPKRVYRARGEVELRSRVVEARWADGRLTLTGEAAIHSVSSSRRWTALKGLVLRGPGRRRIRLLARTTRRPGRTSGAWTGFEVSLDPAKLKTRGGWTDGVWELDAAMFNAGVYRRAALGGGVAGSGANPPYHYVTGEVRIVPEVHDGRFRLRVETVRAVVTGLNWSGDDLVVSGTLRAPAAELRLTSGADTVTVPLRTGAGAVPPQAERTAQTSGPGAFTAAVSLRRLLTTADGDGIDDTRRWDVAVADPATGQVVPLVPAEDVADVRRLVGSVEAAAERGPGGYLRIGVRTARLAVTACELTGEAVLRLTGTHPAGASGEIVLRHREMRLEHGFALRPDGTAEIPLTAVPKLAGILPVRSGDWDVLFRRRAGDRALTVAVAPEAAAGLPATVEARLRTYTLQSPLGGLALEVGTDLRPDERNAGTKIREEARRQVARTGLRDTVLFTCFNGKQYSDSTRAVHEELARRDLGLEQLWVVHDQQVALPDTIRPVRRGGREWAEALASSRYIVANHRIGDWFQRHPDQIVLQTWHGTPLKKIGGDVKEVHFAYVPGMQKGIQAQAAGGAARLPEWTHLVSPNPFSTEIFRRAFRFKGELIETGYPRNDILYSPDAARIAERVRARIGVPPGKKVVLYAPTWRDDQFYERGRYKLDWRLDMDRFRAVLGDDHVLLVRLHPNVVDGAPASDLVFDVSNYPDIAELYLAADVLVSDYSSVMFDFANLGRPMLFFTYDLAHYRDTLRGFYFDFEKEAPGPLLENPADLIDALRDVDAVAQDYREAYAAFAERFCSLEDGKAASRVIDRVFSSS